MDESVRVSFDTAQLREIKRQTTGNRPYADRVSLSFAFQLFMVKQQLREDHLILDVIDGLEGLGPRRRPGKERQFRHSPLHPFWHVHWFAPRHILRNIGIQWNLTGEGDHDPLTPMLQKIASEYGNDPARWPGILVHDLVTEGYKRRARRGLTGDWIIYGKHEGHNYYLALATHDEGKRLNAIQLHTDLRQGSAAEFPFLFQE